MVDFTVRNRQICEDRYVHRIGPTLLAKKYKISRNRLYQILMSDPRYLQTTGANSETVLHPSQDQSD